MRVLVECTYVFEHPNDNSGIQRVVRNVVNNLPSIDISAACIPVIFKHGKVYQVTQSQPLKHEAGKADLHTFLANARTWFNDLRFRYWRAHALFQQRRPFTWSHNLRRILYVLFRLLSLWYVIPMAIIKLLNKVIVPADRAELLQIREDDVLLLLDSSWHSDFFHSVEKLKLRGVKVVGVVYDLIPLTHPQFCDEGLVKVFERWFQWIVINADGFLCISRTVAEHLQDYSRAVAGPEAISRTWYDYFYLGTDLDQVCGRGSISAKVTRVFKQGRPVFLLVSTIEPRKNHKYLLDAFDQLWSCGNDVVLCFVGKVGWKCDDLLARIMAHGEWERRLFMLNNLSDTELEFCYKSSRALVFPSYVEGFGLPVIEALQRGLPVFASDIPVFREVGGKYVQYFSLDNASALAEIISNHERDGYEDLHEKIDGWCWMNWKESSQKLFEKLESNLLLKAADGPGKSEGKLIL